MILKMRKIVQKKVKTWGPLLLCTCFSCNEVFSVAGTQIFFCHSHVSKSCFKKMWHISQISTLKWTVTKKIYKRKFFSFYWFTLLSRCNVNKWDQWAIFITISNQSIYCYNYYNQSISLYGNFDFVHTVLNLSYCLFWYFYSSFCLKRAIVSICLLTGLVWKAVIFIYSVNIYIYILKRPSFIKILKIQKKYKKIPFLLQSISFFE